MNTDNSSASTSFGIGSQSSYTGSFLSGLGNVANGIFGTDFGLTDYANSYDNALGREYNAEQAKLDRDFQSSENDKAYERNLYLSNTAYQRAMADMKAAGLNPLLAYQQGGSSSGFAESPSGSSASYSGGSGSRSALPSAKDKLLSLAKIVAGAYTGSVGMAAQGFTEITVDSKGYKRVHSRVYK